MESLTPRAIVAELDLHIVGQTAAKRAVAIALRNRWRRRRTPAELQAEITPKNIILIGPTGVGKTEIARRLAKLAQAPFVKVEASKFTEVGYVGRDVESMVRDLVEASIAIVREEERARVEERALEAAEDRIYEATRPDGTRVVPPRANRLSPPEREKLRAQFRNGSLDTLQLEVEVAASGMAFMKQLGGGGDIEFNLGEMFRGMPGMGNRTRQRRVDVAEALKLLRDEEAERRIDQDRLYREALTRAQENGIIFLDEIDKIAHRKGTGQGGPDVSREGVQRDLLPVVEGCTVMTKYGPIQTDHILFIAAGAFHIAKPTDLIPELQGRFPIRVELESLTRADLVRILCEPQNALIRQYRALIAAEGVELDFEPKAIEAIAELAEAVNQRTQNIGARRLHTMLEKLLEEISFSASESEVKKIMITEADVRERIGRLAENEDLSRYIL